MRQKCMEDDCESFRDSRGYCNAHYARRRRAGAPLEPYEILRDAITPPRGDWMERAKCADAEPETFYPEKGQPADTAKAICAMCPVTKECLEYALANGEKFGVFGGLSPRERQQVQGRRAA